MGGQWLVASQGDVSWLLASGKWTISEWSVSGHCVDSDCSLVLIVFSDGQ